MLSRTEKLFSVNLAGSAEQMLQLDEVRPSEINLTEKDIENWIVQNTELLFREPESVMIVAQEFSGEKIADILALDSEGSLIIIEAKRDWGSRTAIGQLLDYAAQLSEWTYDNLASRWEKHKEKVGKETDNSLLQEFREFIYNPKFSKENIARQQRLFLLAPYYETEVLRIVRWLQKYEVPVDVAPFRVFSRSDEEVLLGMSQIDVQPLQRRRSWQGDWFFNTNESDKPGAYEKMIRLSRIAVYGYDDGQEMLEKPVEEPGRPHKRKIPIPGQVMKTPCRGFGRWREHHSARSTN